MQNLSSECSNSRTSRANSTRATDLSYGYGKLEFDDGFVLNIIDPNYEE